MQIEIVINFAISGINIYNCEIRGGISLKIGEFIRSKRKEKKLTLKQLAKEIGLSHTYLSQIELGDRKASPDVLRQLSEALNVSYSELMEVAGYTKESDKIEIMMNELLTFNEMKQHKTAEFESVSLELSRSDLDEETRKHLKKVAAKSKSEVQKLDVLIRFVDESIRSSEEYKEAAQAKNMIENFVGETTTKIDLENVFNMAQEITINGKTLTEDDKQKALQILKLTFDK